MDSQTIAQILQANGGKMTGSASGTSGKSSAQITSILQAAGGKPTGGSQNPPSGGFMQNVFGNGNGNFGENLLKNTIGSNGLGGLIGRPIVSAITAGATKQVADAAGQASQANAAALKYANANPQNPQSQNLINTVKSNAPAQQIASDTEKNLQGAQETQEQNLGIAMNSASTLAMGATAPIGTLGKIVEGSVIGGLSGGGQAASENKSAKDVAIQTGIGAGIGATIPGVTSLGGKILKSISGGLSGAGSDVLTQALKNPDEVYSAIQKYATTPEAKQTLVDQAKAAISAFLHNRNEQFGETLNNLTSKVGFQGKQNVIDSFGENVGKFGGKVNYDGTLSFQDTTLNKSSQKALQDAWEMIGNWKNTSVKGLDGLRQGLGGLMDDYKLGENSRINVVLGAVKKDLTTALNDNVPGYSDMLSKYGQDSQLAKNIGKELNLTGSARPTTQLNSIMRLFKKDPSVMKSLVAVMGQDEADSFLNQVAGSILSSWMPEGATGKLLSTLGEAGAGALGFSGAGALPTAGAALSTAALASPRISGTAATILGRPTTQAVGNVAQKGAELTAPKFFGQ